IGSLQRHLHLVARRFDLYGLESGLFGGGVLRFGCIELPGADREVRRHTERTDGPAQGDHTENTHPAFHRSSFFLGAVFLNSRIGYRHFYREDITESKLNCVDFGTRKDWGRSGRLLLVTTVRRSAAFKSYRF